MKPDTAAVRSWGQIAIAASAISGLAWAALLILLAAAPATTAMARAALAGFALFHVTAVAAVLGYKRHLARVNAEATRETDRLNAIIARSSRDNDGKSRFIATLSHELRTPLNAIVGYTEFLLSPAADHLGKTQRREYLQTVRDSSRHLQGMIAGVLDLSRIEKGKLKIADQEIDAAEIAESAVKMCRDAAEQADVTIVAEVIEGIELRCDATRISQVLVNLVINAIKFSMAGGTVRLAFETALNGGLAIAVHDRGIGIAAADLVRIFEPFMQADQWSARRFGGMGLGLPIARRIAMLHGGDVTIESAEGAGTTARLILPPSRVMWPAQEAAETICAA